MPSFLYSARTDSNTASVNMRCSFSFAKLMHNWQRWQAGNVKMWVLATCAAPHLLERIVWETLKPENIDGADEVARRTAEHERRIDRFDEHIEEPRVERLAQVVYLL